MKNLFFLLSLITISSCCSNRDIIRSTFTNEEKLFIPYREHDVVKWNKHNGETIIGTVTNYNISIDRDSDEYCTTYEREYLDVNLLMDNEHYSISLSKMSENNLNLNISQSINEVPKRGFGVSISHYGFTTIEFNNETFNDAVKLEAYGEGDIYLGTLIYSKTNGIEFILFEDGTWYKRAE